MASSTTHSSSLGCNVHPIGCLLNDLILCSTEESQRGSKWLEGE